MLRRINFLVYQRRIERGRYKWTEYIYFHFDAEIQCSCLLQSWHCSWRL